MNKEKRAADCLRQLGLNRLESEVYTFLLRHPPMTAYRVGKEIGRPTANVYKAVESLARRGAVVVEEGDNRVCRAVSVDDFVGQLRHRFLESARAARDVLSNLAEPTIDARVYRVESVDALFERASSMLADASTVAVVDAFPRVLARLVPAIEKATDRGLRVAVQAYLPIVVDGADVVVVPRGEASVAAWRAEQLNLVVDGREVLVGLLDPELERVHQAIWSRSVYLACLLHGGLSAEHTLIGLRALIERGAEFAELVTAIQNHRFFRDHEVPGHQELVARLIDRSDVVT